MQIVTMTTDFGLQDYYVAALKGMMLTRYAALNIVDISNTIKAHNVVQAAFTFKSAWHFFPKGTIHFLSVNNFQYRKNRFLAVEKDGHFFVGPDNGILSLALGLPPQYPVRALQLNGYNLVNIGEAVAQAVAHISRHRSLENMGENCTDYLERSYFQPVIYQKEIRGIVIHIDNYDNVILNITRDLFDEVGLGRPFRIYYKRFDPITTISKFYTDVPMGETLCLFNSDYLEIAVNMGRAAELLGLKVEDGIQIEFD